MLWMRINESFCVCFALNFDKNTDVVEFGLKTLVNRAYTQYTKMLVRAFNSRLILALLVLPASVLSLFEKKDVHKRCGGIAA